MNAIVRAPNWIGDAVMALPFLYGLSMQEGMERITVFARPVVADLYSMLDGIDIKIVSVEKNASLPAILSMKHEPVDIAFVLPFSFRSTVPFFVKTRNTAGLSSLENFFMIKSGINIHEKDFRKRHLASTYLDLLGKAGMRTVSRNPSFRTDDSFSAKFGLEKDAYFAVVPGASYGPAKMWGTDNYADCINPLRDGTGLKPVILGGKAEKETGKELSGKTGGAIDFTGRTSMSDMLSILKNAKFTIANDSGMMHVSSAVGTRVYAIFGSTTPVWTGPLRNAVIFYSERACSPCFKRTCMYGHYGCLFDIAPESVYNRIMQDLKNG